MPHLKLPFLMIVERVLDRLKAAAADGLADGLAVGIGLSTFGAVVGLATGRGELVGFWSGLELLLLLVSRIPKTSAIMRLSTPTTAIAIFNFLGGIY